jgi:hypothetical protein
MFFENTWRNIPAIAAGAILVCAMSVSPLVLERFRGRAYYIEEGTQICRFPRPYVGERGRMTTGLSVAHTAFYLARAMGCDPIVLVAQDLSFSGGRTHASGTEHTWGGAVDENAPDLAALGQRCGAMKIEAEELALQARDAGDFLRWMPGEKI